MDWQKIVKFVTPIVLIVVASAALFLGVAGFTEWAVACGGFVGLWIGGQKVIQKLTGKK